MSYELIPGFKFNRCLFFFLWDFVPKKTIIYQSPIAPIPSTDRDKS